MKFLKHLGFLGLAGALVLTVVLSGGMGQAAGQSPGLQVTPVSNASARVPILTAYGKVKSVTGSVVTLDVGGHDMTLTVDDNTDVIARGAARATRTAASGQPIADLVRNGDLALVAYRELNGSKRISEIMIKGRNTIASR
jgi:multidrug efflux pump subunit AcrA (membrane-fusion protein)